MRLNAELNRVAVEIVTGDLIDTMGDWEVILAGDVFYDRELAGRLTPWFSALLSRGTLILAGDPGRAYLPNSGLQRLASYAVPVTRDLEDAEIKETSVWEIREP